MDNAPLEQLLRHVRRLVAPAGTEDDGELLARFVARRDEAAFAAMMRRHGPMILGVCRSLLHDPHAADDAFQATFLVLLRRAASLEKRPSLGAWLYGVAYRTALKARTSAARRRTRERKAAAMSVTEAHDREADPELDAALHEELGRLPEKYRTPLIACYLQGQTTDEAAQRIGCPRGTILSRLSRGRDLLRARLSRRGITPATGIAVALAATAGVAVPPVLVGATLKLGRALVAGKVLEGSAVRLAEAVLKEMTVAKFKLFGAIALVFLIAGLGVGVTAYFWGGGDEPPLAPAPLEPPADGKDRNGDPLPDGAVARIGSARLWADCLALEAIGFPSGQRLVTFARDGTAHLWDVDNGKEIRKFERGWPAPLPGSVFFVPVSPDGKRFAFAGRAKDARQQTDGIIHIHETDKGAEVGRIEAGGDVGPLAFSSDGKLLAASGYLMDRKIRIFAVDGGKEIKQVGDGRWVTLSAAFSPDAKTLAVAEIDKTSTLWDIANAKMLHRLIGHKGEPLDFLLAVGFSADGKSVVSIGGDRTVRKWDATTGKESDSFGVVKGGRGYLSPGAERAAVVSRDNLVEVWDVASRKKLCSWQGPQPQHGRTDVDGFLAAAFSPDGKVIAVGNSPRVELRSVETGKEVRPGHYEQVRVVALSPDGRVTATDSGDGTSRFWETATGRELARFDRDRTTAGVSRRFGFSDDGKEVILTDRNTVLRLSAASGKEKGRASFMDETSRGALAVSADGSRALIGGISGRTWLIDTANGKELREFEDDDKTGPWGLLGSAAFSADGKTLAIDYKWGSAVGDFPVHHNEQKVKVWDVATGRRLAEFDSGGPVALSPDGKTLATVGDKQPWARRDDVPGQPPQPPGKPPKVHLWDVATGNELTQFDTDIGAFGYEGLPLTFSPDGKRLATGGGDGSVRLWDAVTGKIVTDLKGGQGRITSLAFSANGKLLASGGIDTTVLLWKVP